MRILDLVLYGKNDKRRILSFRPNSVNIITGDSKTGKSAVGDIISYCLGGSKCDIAEGIVRKSVEWYALRLKFTNTQLFVARKNPEPGQQSCSKCYIEEANIINIPESATFEPNTDVDGLEKRLSGLLGILENLNIPEGDATRHSLSANVRHAILYCFLNQGEIASNDILFHRQQEQFIPQAIKDTMPYFLGAVSEDAIALMNERKEVARKIRLDEKILSENSDLIGGGLEIGSKLIGEAKGLHLLNSLEIYDCYDRDSIISILKPLLEWEPMDEFENETEQLDDLLESLHKERSAMSDINTELKNIKQWNQSASDYEKETGYQTCRLKSIGLFEGLNFDPAVCPLCSAPLKNPLPSVEAIRQSIIKLDESISDVTQIQPEIGKIVAMLEEKRAEKAEKIRSLKNQINGFYEQANELTGMRDSVIACARLVGRVSLWLERVQADRNLDEIRQRVENLKERLNSIERQLDVGIIQERVTSALSRLQIDMTKWASELDMEYAQCPYRLDYNKLTVAVDADEGPIYLKTMGSGSNWLDAHIITYFAMQKYFQEKKRPVPGFIFMDQPSQTYFPDGTDESNADWTEIQKLYKFIFDTAESIGNGLQVIVVDHAKYSDTRFESNVIEDWHGGQKLIPDDWYN